MKLCYFEDCYKDRILVFKSLAVVMNAHHRGGTLSHPQILRKRRSQFSFRVFASVVVLMCVRNRLEGASPGQQRRITGFF